MPKTPKQAIKKVKHGTGALVAIETWVSAPGPNESSWDLHGYGTRRAGQVLGCKSVAKHKHGHKVHLPLDGGQGSYGAYGVAFGANICGVWNRDDSHRIIDLTLKESQHRHAVKDFKKIAKAILSQFW